MNLRDADLATLAMIKAGLTLDQKDGTLLLDDAEELMFFTAEIAPGHYLYTRFRTRGLWRSTSGSSAVRAAT